MKPAHAYPAQGESHDFAGMTHRPLVGLVVCFVAGTWLGQTLGVSSFVPLIALCLCLFLWALMWLRVDRSGGCHSAVSAIVVHACVIFAACLGGGPYVQRAGLCNASSLFAQVAGEKVQVIGVVSDDPVLRVPADGKVCVWKFRLCVETCLHANNISSVADMPVHVVWYGPKWLAERKLAQRVAPPYYGRRANRSGHRSRRVRAPGYGERWIMSGTVVNMRSHDHGPASMQRTKFGLRAGSYRSRFVSAGHGSRFTQYCLRARRRAASQLTVGIENRMRTIAVLRALLLGYRSDMAWSVRDTFANTGTLHIFAVSGLHVGMIAMFITFVLSAFRISRVYWALFLAPLLIGYTIATGARPSAVRACIMAIIYFLAPLLGRRPDIPSALAAAALLILAWNPTQLFEVGFIYSFVVMTGIIVLYPIFDRPLRRLWEPDPFRLPDSAGGDAVTSLDITVFRRTFRVPRPALRVPVRYVCCLLAVSCSAWLASTPLTAYYFGMFVPIALLCNLIVIPLAFLIVLAGCLSLVLGPCVALFADIFNHANLALVGLLVKSMEFMSSVPFGSVDVPKPPAWCVWTWYGVLGAIAFAMHRRHSSVKSPNKQPDMARPDAEH